MCVCSKSTRKHKILKRANWDGRYRDDRERVSVILPGLYLLPYCQPFSFMLWWGKDLSVGRLHDDMIKSKTDCKNISAMGWFWIVKLCSSWKQVKFRCVWNLCVNWLIFFLLDIVSTQRLWIIMPLFLRHQIITPSHHIVSTQRLWTCKLLHEAAVEEARASICVNQQKLLLSSPLGT